MLLLMCNPFPELNYRQEAFSVRGFTLAFYHFYLFRAFTISALERSRLPPSTPSGHEAHRRSGLDQLSNKPSRPPSTVRPSSPSQPQLLFGEAFGLIRVSLPSFWTNGVDGFPVLGPRPGASPRAWTLLFELTEQQETSLSAGPRIGRVLSALSGERGATSLLPRLG